MFKFYIAKCGTWIETVFASSEEVISGYVHALGSDYSYAKVPA